MLADLYQTLLTGNKWDGLPIAAIHGYLLEINGLCYILVLPESAIILATGWGQIFCTREHLPVTQTL